MVRNMSRGYTKDPNRILKLRAQGCSYKVISERMGVSFATISQLLRELNTEKKDHEQNLPLHD